MGSLRATGTRVIVVFRELPDDREHCLVVQADTLPELFRDAVSHIVTHSGQNTKDLYEALHRETMPNGENMLAALDKYRLLVKKPTSAVLMHPTRDYAVGLDELNEQLRAVEKNDKAVDSDDIQKKFNPYQEKAEDLDELDAKNISASLMVQADDLEEEAKRKRERAYKLRPELEAKYNEIHGIAETSEAAPSFNPADWSDDVALDILNELMNRFPIMGEVAPVETSETAFVIELAGLSQRKATEQMKAAWAIANPAKVKKEK